MQMSSWVGLLGVHLLVPFCLAGLGEKKDAAKLQVEKQKGRKLFTQNANYRSSQYTTENGQVVTEFFRSDNGIVFAVKSRGPRIRNLQDILGQFHVEYQERRSLIDRQPGSRLERVDAGKFVVLRSGHQRDLHFTAYIPDQLPEGVTLQELR